MYLMSDVTFRFEYLNSYEANNASISLFSHRNVEILPTHYRPLPAMYYG